MAIWYDIVRIVYTLGVYEYDSTIHTNERENTMVAKKTRGKPKPNKVYYQPSQGAMRRT